MINRFTSRKGECPMLPLEVLRAKFLGFNVKSEVVKAKDLPSESQGLTNLVTGRQYQLPTDPEDTVTLYKISVY